MSCHELTCFAGHQLLRYLARLVLEVGDVPVLARGGAGPDLELGLLRHGVSDWQLALRVWPGHVAGVTVTERLQNGWGLQRS